MGFRPPVLALVGPRGAGKTTLGRSLAQRLGWQFADTDRILAERAGCAAGDLLARVGEPEFRRLERRAVLGALRQPGVVALGGGAVLAPAVRTVLTARDVFTVFLHAAPEALWERIRCAVDLRPPLTKRAPEDEVRWLLARRWSLYERVADLSVQTFPANVDSCCGAVLARMQPAS